MTEIVHVPAVGEVSPIERQLALMVPAAEFCEKLSRSALVPAAYKGKPQDMLAAAIMGDGLGLDAFTAWQEIFVDRGRVGLTAKLMRALAKRGGCELWIEEANGERVTMAGRPRGSENTSRITWTMDMARNAKLDKKDNWRSHPQAMLLARASAQLVRIIAPETLIGFTYSIEEIQDGVNEETFEDLNPPADAPPPKPKTSSRKAPSKPAKAKTAPAPAPAVVDPISELDELDEMAAGDVPADPDDEVVEAEIVDDGTADALAAEAEGGKSYPPAQALAMRASSDGLSTMQRYGLNIAITGGRAKSGKDLTGDEVHVAFGLLDLLRDGGAELVESAPGEWTVLVDGEEEHFGVDISAAPGERTGSGGPPDDVEGWSALRKEHRWRIADVLKAARVAAEAQGLEEVPTSIRDLAAGPVELRVAVLAELGVVS